MGFSRIIPKLWLSDFLVEYNGTKKQQNGQHNFQNHSIEWENMAFTLQHVTFWQQMLLRTKRQILFTTIQEQ
jgi:hypothetical protein